MPALWQKTLIGNKVAKIAWTKNGNVKVTMNTVQVQAVRELLSHVKLGTDNDITLEVLELVETLEHEDFVHSFFDAEYTLRCKRNKAEDTFELFFD